jgi:aspartyl-tRNA(Asn)/glutamyl-tRNA(Gln) amidotransferase subunit A
MTEPTVLHELTAVVAAKLIRTQRVSPVELVEALLVRASHVDPQVQAWETLDPEAALDAAHAAERAVSSAGQLGPLHGVPFGAKDIFDTAGLRTAAGFAPFDHRIPSHDAEAVARLKRAGAIVLGKTVTTQFAQADPSKTRNPWSADATPGGSSSGSAAGVAAREMPIALGSQTAGSVLRPAAYNGVIGFKPTYGRVSKRGVMPLAWSLDHVGLLARSVEDCELWLRIVADPLAAGGAPQAAATSNATAALGGADSEAPPKLGVFRAGLDRASPRVRDHLADVAKRFEADGARVTEIGLELELDLVLAVHHVTMQTETAAVHRQLLEQYPGAHAPRLRAYAQVGQLLPGAAYVHAQRLRRRIRGAMLRALEGFDGLLLPTASDVAPTPETTGDTSLQAPFSLVGFPSLSLPSGLHAQPKLPLAIQLVSAPWEEARLLSAARWCEAHLPPMPAPSLTAAA